MPNQESKSRRLALDRINRAQGRTTEAHQILQKHVRDSGLKSSAKRDRILDVFLETQEHLSTEQLYRIVRAKFPSIGYTTVYRTLKLFAECGLASEVEFHDGLVRYERGLNRRTHHHMVCTSCGDSVEFFAPEIESIERRVGKKFAFIPTRHSFQIYGTCKNCRARENDHSITKN